MTIDRIDPNGNYEPLNCRWISQKEQTRNTSRNTPVIVNGVEYDTLIEACEALNRVEDYSTIRQRIARNGWTADEAFTEPIKPRKPITVCIDGKEYSNAREACKALNMNYDNVKKYRLHHHITWETAVSKYYSKQENKERRA